MKTSLLVRETIVKEDAVFCSIEIARERSAQVPISKRGATMAAWRESHQERRRRCLLVATVASLLCFGGCHPFPIAATFRGDVNGNVTTESSLHGSVEVKMPSSVDPGQMVPTVVRAGRGDDSCARIALIDVDGLLVNQNFGSLMSIGDNPLSSFRDKLEAAARDPRVAGVVLRMNSPGGSVTTCDIMAEELRRFRAETHKPVVASLMDLATAGAYFVAIESDAIVAHPTALTGGLGVIFNHYNLEDAMGSLNVSADPVKSGKKIDMGTLTAPLDDDTRAMLQQMADAYRDHLFPPRQGTPAADDRGRPPRHGGRTCDPRFNGPKFAHD